MKKVSGKKQWDLLNSSFTSSAQRLLIQSLYRGADFRRSAGSLVNHSCTGIQHKVIVMLYRCRLVFVVALLLCLGVQLSVSQHWSHGWYPGGKREIDSYSSPEMSGEIKLCEAGECSYLRPLRTNILKSILLDALMRELQKRK